MQPPPGVDSLKGSWSWAWAWAADWAFWGVELAMAVTFSERLMTEWSQDQCCEKLQQFQRYTRLSGASFLAGKRPSTERLARV